MAKKENFYPTFTDVDIQQDIDIFLNQNADKIQNILDFIGVEIVNKAKDKQPPESFNDKTGNLRSSIGYSVFLNGKQVSGNFTAVKGGSEGKSIGQSLAKSIGSLLKGFSLVIVAGMDYAQEVEARGKDVISGSLPDKAQLTKDFNFYLNK